MTVLGHLSEALWLERVKVIIIYWGSHVFKKQVKCVNIVLIDLNLRDGKRLLSFESFKLNSYLNASIFLSLCHMRISLFRMRILVCEVEKWKRACEKAMQNACVVSMNSALSRKVPGIKPTVCMISSWQWHQRAFYWMLNQVFMWT